MTRDSSRFDLDGIGYPVRHATVRRMALLKLMIERIGVDENRGPLISAILRQLERTCLDCARAGECGRGGHSGHTGAEDTGGGVVVQFISGGILFMPSGPIGCEWRN